MVDRTPVSLLAGVSTKRAKPRRSEASFSSTHGIKKESVISCPIIMLITH